MSSPYACCSSWRRVPYPLGILCWSSGRHFVIQVNDLSYQSQTKTSTIFCFQVLDSESEELPAKFHIRIAGKMVINTRIWLIFLSHGKFKPQCSTLHTGAVFQCRVSEPAGPVQHRNVPTFDPEQVHDSNHNAPTAFRTVNKYRLIFNVGSICNSVVGISVLNPYGFLETGYVSICYNIYLVSRTYKLFLPFRTRLIVYLLWPDNLQKMTYDIYLPSVALL